MTDEEIASYPDKVALVKMLLARLNINTNRMYELEKQLNCYQPGEAQKKIKDLEAQLETIGLIGDRQWYCPKCEMRTSATKNLSLGVGWVCSTCQSPAIRIADLDPIFVKKELDASIKAQQELDRLNKRLMKEIEWYKKHGRSHPGTDRSTDSEPTRAERSIHL